MQPERGTRPGRGRSRGRFREVEIPLDGISGEDSARGLARLRAALGRRSGLMAAEIDEAAGVLRLRYDPKYVSPLRVQELARRLEPGLARQLERCTLCVLGLRGAEADPGSLRRRLEEAPGVARAVVCPAAGMVSVEYDTGACTHGQIEERVEEAGYTVSPVPQDRATTRAAHARDARARLRMAGLTAACAVLAVAGFAAEHVVRAPRAVVIVLYAGAYLAGALDATRRAWRELRGGELSVDLLMVLAAAGAAAVGAWPEGAVLLFLFSLSNTLEQYILGRTRHAIEALLDLTPEEALVLRDGREARIPAAELVVGDVIRVRPGERIAADGLIRAGRTAVDQSAMTGESIPVERGAGDPVFAATLNGAGAVEVEVTRVAGDTALARIVRLVEEAQGEKAPSQRFTEWFGARYTLAVLALSGLTFAGSWLLGSPAGAAFYRAMTVLVVASPCAVVISIPAAILSAIAGAARGGILFKGGAHLEEAARVKAVAVDKTGTLTLGRPRVVALRAGEGVGEEELLRLAASAEARSEHPLARAVLEAAVERGVGLIEATELQAEIGHGLTARVGGRVVRVGKAEFCHGRDRPPPAALAVEAEALADAGNTVVHVGDERGVIGLLAVSDTLRPSAAAAVEALRGQGVEHVVMLTGDQRVVARAIASGLGMEYQAELLPEDKLRAVQRLRDRFGSVAMLGDGINDAPALAAASLGVSLGAGATDVALETADVVLMSGDLTLLPAAIALARRARAVVLQNLVLAFGMMALLLAATYLDRLPLPLAVLGHEGSTVMVILNGVRLLRKPAAT